MIPRASAILTIVEPSKCCTKSKSPLIIRIWISILAYQWFFAIRFFSRLL
jgi:hypothetical protein